jgi:hydroxyquinol 1,2-dioxygenase
MDQREAGSAASGTRDLADGKLTEAVLASFDGSRSPRFKRIMQSLIRHLHAFVSDVGLTEEEWFQAIDFLTRTGHMSDDKRQEFILLSDTLGLSMLVIGINNKKPPGATQATVFGPFFVENSPFFENGDDLANGAPGEPCFVEGRVSSVSGEPIAGAHLAIWQADEDGFYDVQYEGLSEARGRGQLRADDEGRFHFRTVRPESYPIPGDGPVGEMLEAADRSLMRPAHIHFMVSAPGYEPVTTHVFEAGEEYLDTDAVFGVKESLITEFVRHEPGTAPEGTGLDVPYYTARYDFVLAPSREADGQASNASEEARTKE